MAACSGLQLERAGDAAGTAAEVAGTAGAVTGNPLFLGAGLDTHIHFICPQLVTEAISAGLTGVGRLMRSRGK